MFTPHPIIPGWLPANHTSGKQQQRCNHQVQIVFGKINRYIQLIIITDLFQHNIIPQHFNFLVKRHQWLIALVQLQFHLLVHHPSDHIEELFV